jgi:hypothetical protein
MKKLYLTAFLLSVWPLSGSVCQAQNIAAFSATWDFNSSSLSGASNQTNVSASSVGVSGVNLSNVAPYPASPGPGSGQYANFQNWATGSGPCNGSEYLEFTVAPQGGKSFSVTNVSFLVNSSGSGPRSLLVTSSVTGFSLGSHLSTVTVTQTASPDWSRIDITVTGLAGYTNVTTPITFRIVACQATATGGALRIDNVVISGEVKLPADLLSVAVKSDIDHIRLTWTTGWERELARFEVQRSPDLGEFLTIGAAQASNNSDRHRTYQFVDAQPLLGVSYYRLRSVDDDGSSALSKVAAIRWQPGDVALRVQPNPAQPDRIHLRLTDAQTATATLWTLTGQPIAGKLMPTSAVEADFQPDTPLSAGIYVLRTGQNGQLKTALVVVR